MYRILFLLISKDTFTRETYDIWATTMTAQIKRHMSLEILQNGVSFYMF